MKISSITNSFKQNKINNSQINPTNYMSQQQIADTVSFSGAKTGLLSKIRRFFNSPKVEEVKPFSKDFFLEKIKEFKNKDGFQIYTPDGKLAHNQKPKDYEITEKTSQKAKNNVVLMSAKGQISLSNMLNFWEHKATHIVTANQKSKKYQILELPKPNPFAIEKAKGLMNRLSNEVNEQLEIAAIQACLKSRKPVLLHGRDIAPIIEAKHFDKIIEKLGIKKTEIKY